jgi:hypothetical protein
LLQNIIKAETQLYPPSGSVEAFAVLLLDDQVEEDHKENHKFERNLLDANHKAQAEAALVR